MFFLKKKHGFLGLTPVYSETTALSKPDFYLSSKVWKRLLFKKQKVDSIGYYDIEDLLPDLNSKLRLFSGWVRLVTSCQEPPVVSTKRAIITSEKRM